MSAMAAVDAALHESGDAARVSAYGEEIASLEDAVAAARAAAYAGPDTELLDRLDAEVAPLQRRLRRVRIARERMIARAALEVARAG